MGKASVFVTVDTVHIKAQNSRDNRKERAESKCEFTVREKRVEENTGKEIHNCKKMDERLAFTYFPQTDLLIFFSFT